MEQQVNLFDCLEQFGTFQNWLENTSKPKFNAAEYLHKGEIIMSLVREKTHRKTNSIFNCVSASVFAKKSSAGEKTEYVVERIAESVVRPAVAKAVASEAVDMESICGLVPERFRDTVRIELCGIGTYEGRLMQAFFQGKKRIKAVSAVVTIGETQYLTCFNGKLSKKQHMRSYALRGTGSSGYRTCVDFARFLAYILLVGELLNAIGGSEDGKNGSDRILAVIQEDWERHLQSATKDGCVYIGKNYANDEVFRMWQQETGMPYFISDSNRGLDRYGVFALQLWKQRDAGLDMLIRNHFMVECYLAALVCERIRDRQVTQYYENLNRDRASVWQTKKNIPEKVIRAMEASGFNKFFGYVEFDEECELDKLKEIEKEFRALNTILKLGKNENVAVRFRKLGNYKASGLYFPSLHCLCVDIRTPSSMAHECFHMIDHLNGMLCRTAAFSKVEQLYTKAFEEAVADLPDDNAQKRVLNGNSKYNREYYLQPMEIFARCGEMYLTRILQVHNSLCIPSKGVPYPVSDELDNAIAQYYSRLFEAEGFDSSLKRAAASM